MILITSNIDVLLKGGKFRGSVQDKLMYNIYQYVNS